MRQQILLRDFYLLGTILGYENAAVNKVLDL